MLNLFKIRIALLTLSLSFISGCLKNIELVEIESFQFVGQEDAIKANNEIGKYDEENFLLVNIISPLNLFRFSKANAVRFNVDAYFCDFPFLKIPNYDLSQDGFGYTPSKVNTNVDNDIVNRYQIVLLSNFSKKLMFETYDETSDNLLPDVFKKDVINLRDVALDVCLLAEAKGAYVKPLHVKTNLLKVPLSQK